MSTKLKVANKMSIAQHNKEHPETHESSSLVTPFLLLLALSLHGVFLIIYSSLIFKAFEGMAIGLSSSLMKTWDIVIAVVLHKWAEALTLVNKK